VAWFGVKFGVKFNKQGFGAWCCVWCCAGAKLTSKGLGASAWCPVWVLSKQARIRCGFPVKKSISVRIRYKSGGLAVGSSGCGAGAVPSKQAKQTSKGLVFDAVRVRWRC
jgi:hypothetical protein